MAHQLAAETAEAVAAIHKVMLGDIEVAYRKVGTGIPVVFLHGLAEDGASWMEIARRLPPGFAAHMPDLRGHGGTSAGTGAGSAAQLADDLLAFLAKVTGPAICVGFSLGGVVVLEAALKRPDLVRKAIVVGTSSKVGRAAATFFAERIAQLQTDPDGFRQSLANDTAAQLASRQSDLDAIAAGRIAAVGTGEGYINAARAMIALAEAPLTERLRSIQVPVFILQGAADVFCPQKAADILRDAMPGAAYAEIPGAGHLMAVDQPDLLALEISRALNS